MFGTVSTTTCAVCSSSRGAARTTSRSFPPSTTNTARPLPRAVWARPPQPPSPWRGAPFNAIPVSFTPHRIRPAALPRAECRNYPVQEHHSRPGLASEPRSAEHDRGVLHLTPAPQDRLHRRPFDSHRPWSGIRAARGTVIATIPAVWLPWAPSRGAERGRPTFEDWSLKMNPTRNECSKTLRAGREQPQRPNCGTSELAVRVSGLPFWHTSHADTSRSASLHPL
jgi:hypothetical protein